MDRRGFLGAILAAAAAPAIVRADSLMRVIPRETVIVASPFDYFDETLREALRAHAERLRADALWMVRRGVPVRVLDDSKVFMKRRSS